MVYKHLFSFFLSYFLAHSLCLHAEAPQSKYVLITGGAGFIGSHVNKMLIKKGYETIIVDKQQPCDMKIAQKSSFIQGDLSDPLFLDQLFSTYHIDAVIHCAALTSMAESIGSPLKYYQNNVCATINLLEAMQKHGSQIFIFASSATVYGITQEHFIKESHPCNPTTPYGQTKLIIEQILPHLENAYHLKYCCLRFFNVTGGDPEGELKDCRPKALNLIQLALRSLLRPGGQITIFGTDYPTSDGTGIRDYIHVTDLTAAIIAAMENLLNGGNSGCYNLGSGRGYSVRQVLTTIEKVTGKTIHVVEGPPRIGDPPVVLACPDKAKSEFGWHPQYEALETMIEHAWKALQ